MKQRESNGLHLYRIAFKQHPRAKVQYWTRWAPSIRAALNEAQVAVKAEYPAGRVLWAGVEGA